MRHKYSKWKEKEERKKELALLRHLSSCVAPGAPAGAVCTAQGRGTNLSWGCQREQDRQRGSSSPEQQLQAELTV